MNWKKFIEIYMRKEVFFNHKSKRSCYFGFPFVEMWKNFMEFIKFIISQKCPLKMFIGFVPFSFTLSLKKHLKSIFSSEWKMKHQQRSWRIYATFIFCMLFQMNFQNKKKSRLFVENKNTYISWKNITE